jgi:hypothetical protein
VKDGGKIFLGGEGQVWKVSRSARGQNFILKDFERDIIMWNSMIP